MEKARQRGWPYGAYGDSLQLLEATEDRLAKERKLPKSFKRFFLVPFYLWVRGIEQMFISYGRLYAVLFAVATIGLIFSHLAPEEFQPFIQQATVYLNVVVWLTLVFAAPSTYCSAGTNSKHVETVTRRLAEWDINTSEHVDRILGNIHIFEERVKRRLVIFRWLLGAGWTLLNSAVLTEVVKTWHARGGVSLMELAVIFPAVGWLLVIFLGVEAYARGTDILFRCLELGCNERIAQIQRQAATSPAVER